MRRLAAFLAPTARFLMRTEIHVYAFAISANVLLSFFPFMVLLLSVCQNVLHWRHAVDVIYAALQDFLPGDPAMFDFVRNNLRAAVASRGRAELLSLVLLLFSSNGVFEPLEVALNRVWGLPRNRSYWRNQWISFGLALLCGGLALLSLLLPALNRPMLDALGAWMPRLARWVGLASLKMATLPVAILVLFLVYWVLPNGPVPWRRALATAIVMGITVEAVRYLYILVWPLLEFRRAYGPFFISVTLVVWGFLSALVVLAGAKISARPARPPGPDADLTLLHLSPTETKEKKMF